MIIAMLMAASQPQPLTIQQRTDIIRHVKDELLDGESARWRWPLAQPGFGVYCGWVNAKNSYGAYIGWRLYRIIGGVGGNNNPMKTFSVISFTLTNDDPDDSTSNVAKQTCSERGYNIERPPLE